MEKTEREEWINLIRNEYDPKPDLGRGNYPAFDSEWDDGAGRIADAILAGKTILLRRQALELDEFLISHRNQVAELFAEIERLRRQLIDGGDESVETEAPNPKGRFDTLRGRFGR